MFGLKFWFSLTTPYPKKVSSIAVADEITLQRPNLFCDVYHNNSNSMSKQELKFLVIHCSATKVNVTVTPEKILRWHTAPPPHGRGWKKPGYSVLIDNDAKIHEMNANNGDQWITPDEITNGVKGINDQSYHICYAGGIARTGKAGDTRSPKQLAVMTKFIFDFIEKHPTIQIAGHNQFANKRCPSFDVPTWLKSIGVDESNIFNPDADEISETAGDNGASN